MPFQKTICPYDCPTSCGLLAEVEDGRIVKVSGDPEHPVCKGLICRKMRGYAQSVNSPERIVTPLKRVGDKGDGDFAPISWDEAVATIAERLTATVVEHGPQAVLPYYYSGVMSHIQRFCGDAFFNRMGACELVMTLCSSAKGAGFEAVVGGSASLDPRELADSDYLIVWGSNMKATRLQSMPDITKARSEGKKVVLIEVYAEAMASSCDSTVLVRPGTDGALALGMMHVLVKDGLANEDYLRREAVGYDDFAATLDAYTPQWAEGVTGVPAADIVALAREFAAAKAPAIILGSGNSRYGNGGMTVRLITILSLLTGAWSRPGGGLCGCTPAEVPNVDMNRIKRPDLRTNTARRVNINRLASALRADAAEPIKHLHVYGSNPVCSVHDQQGIRAGLSRPDLFTVVHECVMSDTARYADIILPVTYSVEQSDCYGSFGYRSFGTARKIVDAPGECKSNWNIFRLLAQAMGYEDAHFQRTEDDLLDELLAHPGPALAHLTDDELATLRTGGAVTTAAPDRATWKTPTGKIQIVNDAVDPAMPCYTEPHGGKEPLRLIAAPSIQTLNSIFGERDDMVRERGSMTLALHPDDAAERGIAEGDDIIAHNDLGEVAFIAHVTPHIAPGTAAAEGTFSTGLSLNGNLVNTLHHERLSDIGEATTLNDNTVDVRKV